MNAIAPTLPQANPPRPDLSLNTAGRSGLLSYSATVKGSELTWTAPTRSGADAQTMESKITKIIQDDISLLSLIQGDVREVFLDKMRGEYREVYDYEFSVSASIRADRVLMEVSYIDPPTDSSEDSSEDSLLARHAEDEPLVVYEARCSRGGVSPDNFLIGVHFIEHESVSDRAWEAFQKRWPKLIENVRANIAYDQDGRLSRAMGSDYPQMEEYLRVLDHGDEIAEVRVVGTYLYLRLILSSKPRKAWEVARSFNKNVYRTISMDKAKGNYSPYYQKVKVYSGWDDDDRNNYEWKPRPCIICDECEEELTDPMHIETCLTNAEGEYRGSEDSSSEDSSEGYVVSTCDWRGSTLVICREDEIKQASAELIEKGISVSDVFSLPNGRVALYCGGSSWGV